jgi:hypothetical protein
MAKQKSYTAPKGGPGYGTKPAAGGGGGQKPPTPQSPVRQHYKLAGGK